MIKLIENYLTEEKRHLDAMNSLQALHLPHIEAAKQAIIEESVNEWEIKFDGCIISKYISIYNYGLHVENNTFKGIPNSGSTSIAYFFQDRISSLLENIDANIPITQEVVIYENQKNEELIKIRHVEDEMFQMIDESWDGEYKYKISKQNLLRILREILTIF